MSELAFHPYAELFPLIEGEAFADLVADIRTNGLRDEIIVLDGAILDGRNRYRACLAADVTPRFEYFRGPRAPLMYAALDPLAFVLSKNLQRRHLDASQRALVAARLATMRQGERTDLPPSEPVPKVDQASAAKSLHVTDRSLRKAKVVLDSGVPDLVKAVESGEINVTAAEEIARQATSEQVEIIARGKKEILAAAKVFRVERQAEKKERRTAREATLGAQQLALPQKRYGVILADPEWRFEPYSRETGMDRAPDNHYPTSPTEAIMARPVGEIAAADCVLFLWATVPMIEAALAVMQAWGFAYKSQFVWVKQRAGEARGPGYWNTNEHELLLIGTRGDIPCPAPGMQARSAFEAPIGAHSAKPDRQYEIIEAYFPNLPKIELNARRAREGWEGWGYEAPPGGGGR